MPASANFAFLHAHDPLLARLPALAEAYSYTDPGAALHELRRFGEVLLRHAAARARVDPGEDGSQTALVRELSGQGVLPREVAELFQFLWQHGPDAAGGFEGTADEAIHGLEVARELGVWFHRTFADPYFDPGPFVPPQLPADPATEPRRQPEELRREVEGPVVQAGPGDLEDEAMEALRERARTAAERITLDEKGTRELIDRQLRDAGWEADTGSLRFAAGTRPQPDRNLAIAEWPTGSGPADYVLFAGLTPVAVVEAKRAAIDVAGALEQARRYSRGYSVAGGETLPGGPWGEFRIPFLFSTNGRPYLRQVAERSGIWFLDARRPTNHPRALQGWHSPGGLTEILAQDAAAAERALERMPRHDLPLRDYQRAAVEAVENALVDGRRAALVAMATGTGKTRTAVGLLYRLLKAGLFRRVLFLVDRNALGEQALGSFTSIRLEGTYTFDAAYEVAPVDAPSDEDTVLDIATVQGMVKRVLYSDPLDAPPPVDAYDLVLVDECHRGYALDREMSDAELTFRSEADYVSKYRRLIEYFDAVKVGLTATPAQHTTEIFGYPVYQYSYRQAVIDGWLVDHEPPTRIVTALAEDGITWEAGSDVLALDPGTAQIDVFEAPDEIHLDVEEFNRRVVTENFNRTVCTELARHIDPEAPGKTLVFCLNDAHADLVVRLLKEAFEGRYGEVRDEAVKKITGAADRPGELIRRYRNERLPSVAVTVDLLTTGIDVPEIVNLVFLRRVRSRILYEQMLGRATRLRPELYGPGDDKGYFRVFDAVDLYAALQPYTEMKPVVVDPDITFSKLAAELAEVKDDDARRAARDQLLAMLRRARSRLQRTRGEEIERLTGMDARGLADHIAGLAPGEVSRYFAERPALAPLLDEVRGGGQRRLLVSEHEDELRRVEHGYGGGQRPADYLEGFREYLRTHLNEIPALQVVLTRPRELTRRQLRELALALDAGGYSEQTLRTAWRDATNQDIAATIIGHVRQAALGEPLLPYAERVQGAVRRILASRAWTQPQRQWLERIGQQMVRETLVDHEALDAGQFRASAGGFRRLDRIFDDRLDQVLGELHDEVWRESA